MFLSRCYRLLRYSKQQARFSTLVTHKTTSFLSPTVGWNHSNNRITVTENCYLTPLETTTFRHQLLQVRWKGRNDGHRFLRKERPPTKKARKKYNRHLAKMREKTDKHGKPGSKAGARRQWAADLKELWLEQADEILAKEQGKGKELIDANSTAALPFEEQYDVGDAMLDDLFGNNALLGSAPTPEPVYLGHKERRYYNRVADKMDQYRKSIDQMKQQELESAKEIDGTSVPVVPPVAKLPSDREISKALRAFRDKRGTKSKPVGIAVALKYLIQDMGVPLSALNEYTFTTLLTCCRTVAEARRVFQIMKENQIEISEYSWSILVDLHARNGDYKGCIAVQEEMLKEGGIAPTLPSYTSLMAACYKVCVDGRVPHNVRAEAAKAGWEKWMEMRIVGIKADCMAYGAILRLTSAVGQPEKALNLLEEMQQMEVKPTTLCFTSVFRAIARSHSTAIRYEKGSSKKNRRREFITMHHGKMAQQVLIMAESAEVVQDEGFVAALALCAAEAGDLATAKAVYVASQIRKLDQFRTIGPDSYLAQLRGEQEQEGYDAVASDSPTQIASGLAGSSESSTDIATMPDRTGDVAEMNRRQVKKQRKPLPTYGQREYGNDSRILSAILHACARSVDQSGIGMMWQGRENNGYLCENSLRLINARRVPQYKYNEIPGQTITDNLTWRGEHIDKDDYRPGKRVSRKFEGVYPDDTGGTLDTLDEDFKRLYMNEDGTMKKEFKPTTAQEIWRMKYGDKAMVNSHFRSPTEDLALSHTEQTYIDQGSSQPTYISDGSSQVEEMYFDYDSMRWKTKSTEDKSDHAAESTSSTDETPQTTLMTNKEESQQVHDVSEAKMQTLSTESGEGDIDNGSDEELYFDDDEMRWKTRKRGELDRSKITSYEAEMLMKKGKLGASDNVTEDGNSQSFEEGNFDLFFTELQAELKLNGEEEVTEEEARELFLMMKDEYNEMMAMDIEELGLGLAGKMAPTGSAGPNVPGEQDDMPVESSNPSNVDDSISAALSERDAASKDQGHEGDENSGDDVPRRLKSTQGSSTRLDDNFAPAEKEFASEPAQLNAELSSNNSSFVNDTGRSESDLSLNDESIFEMQQDHGSDYDVDGLAEIRQLLPAFSDKRLLKTLNVFGKSLGTPPLLHLVQVAREQMPDYVTSTWLKKMGALTAKYVVKKAEQEGKIDAHILNGALELHASAGFLDEAVDFYFNEFGSHKIAPTGYTDRLVLQMFLKNNRLQRALAFKQILEEKGRVLDLKGFGALIEYFGNHHQLGSAMMVLKECLSVHNSAPGESSLASLRSLVRQSTLDEKCLTDLIGPDPVEWLRYGEAKLKREMSKKGRRDTLMARNQLLRI